MLDVTMTLPTSPPLRLGDRTIVGSLRLRASGPVDSSAARLRLESVLGEVGLGKALPASALLCIRALRDPLPGSLSLDARGRPPSRWKEAMDAELARVTRGAARPIDGVVPAAHNAVLFRDRAELLACLANDWIRGQLASHWWWRHVVRSDATGRIAPAQWIAEPHYVPAAAELLAQRGGLVQFADALEREEVRLIVEGVQGAFGMSSKVDRPSPDVAAPQPARQAPLPPPASEAWSRWVPEVPGLDRGPTRAFVAITLGLARAPSVARRPELIEVVEKWLAEESVEHSKAAPTSTGRAADGAAREEAPRASPREDDGSAEAKAWASRAGLVMPDDAAPASPGAPRAETSVSSPPAALRTVHEPPTITPAVPPTIDAPVVSPGTMAPSAPFRELAAKGAANVSVTMERDGKAAAVVDDVGVPPAPRAREGEEELVETAVAAPAPEESTPLLRATATGTAIATAYGGAFFLLNVALALDLYGDFTRPRSRALAPSPWTLTAQLARSLLGADADPNDALWWILRDLAGASDEEEAWPSELRVPPDWLAPFPERRGWTWSARDARFRVEHPARFVVLDAPLAENVDAQRTAEWARYSVVDAVEAPGALPVAPWPELLALFVRARLHAALRADTAEASVRLALALRARVRATDSHVDVHMVLADLPIEIRLAGLDRDPGWIPAAGRFVAFHFE